MLVLLAAVTRLDAAIAAVVWLLLLLLLCTKHLQSKRPQQTFSKQHITTPFQNLAQQLKHVGNCWCISLALHNLHPALHPAAAAAAQLAHKHFVTEAVSWLPRCPTAAVKGPRSYWPHS
jgi:hypothetical protein